MTATARTLARPRNPHARRRGEAPLDDWSAVHIASGAVLGFARLSWPTALALLIGFEVLEAGLRHAKTVEGGGVFEYESWPNIVADVLLGALGYAIAR